MFVGPMNSARDPLVCIEMSKITAQQRVNNTQQCMNSALVPKTETRAGKKKGAKCKMQTQVHPDPNAH